MVAAPVEDLQVHHVSFSDLAGGANMSSYRLHRGLVELGVDSKMLVARKKSQDDTVIALEEGVQWGLSLFRIFVAQSLLRCGFPDPHFHSLNLLPSFLNRRVRFPAAGITHLHWIHGEMIGIHEMPSLGGTMVWTLHDGWALEGTKHFTQTESVGLIGQLLDQWTSSRKLRHWQGWDLQLIAMCQAMKAQAAEHPILSRFPCEVLPNSVNTLEFYFEEQARRSLEIPQEEIVFVFVCAGKDFEHLKGFDVIEKILERLGRDNGKRCTLAILGGKVSEEECRPWGKILRLGHLAEPAKMREWYSAADIFLAPSRYEAFGNAIIEAAACRLPCVAFRLGGPADTIVDGVSGFLLPPEDTDGFFGAVQKLLIDSELRQTMGKAAEARARECYSREVVAKLHLELYQRLIENSRRS